MTSEDHYWEAERLLAAAEMFGPDEGIYHGKQIAALVHAILALVKQP